MPDISSPVLRYEHEHGGHVQRSKSSNRTVDDDAMGSLVRGFESSFDVVHLLKNYRRQSEARLETNADGRLLMMRRLGYDCGVELSDAVKVAAPRTHWRRACVVESCRVFEHCSNVFTQD